jgi:hypothetical protein
MKLKVILTFCLVALCSAQIMYAQFRMEEFLGTARQDVSLSPTQAKIDFLKENNFNGPWISRVEFRTRSNDSNLSQEDFRFRLTPGNPAELKAYKRYYHKQVTLLNTEYKDVLNTALKSRYGIAIDHMFESFKKANLESRLLVNKQIIDMINSGTGIYSLDIGDLIDAQSEELDMGLAIQNSKIRLSELEYVIKDHYSFSGDINWSEIELMEVTDILVLFNEFKNSATGQHINLVKLEQRNQLDAERFNIEKSEILRNIGYFQAEYDTDRGNEPSRHFGYQIGIRIPIVNPDKPDLNRRKLATMDDAALLTERQEEYRRKMELSVLRMDSYAIQWHEISEKLELMRTQNLLDFQRIDRSVNIRDLLKINEFHMELLDKKNTIEKKIFDNYLEYLDLCGLLTETPLRNYLAKDLPEF